MRKKLLFAYEHNIRGKISENPQECNVAIERIRFGTKQKTKKSSTKTTKKILYAMTLDIFVVIMKCVIVCRIVQDRRRQVKGEEEKKRESETQQESSGNEFYSI